MRKGTKKATASPAVERWYSGPPASGFLTHARAVRRESDGAVVDDTLVHQAESIVHRSQA